MQSLSSRLGLSLLGLMLASSAHGATTLTGQLSSTLTLTASCQVNGAVGTTGLSFGTLNFGSQTTLFSSANAQVVSGSNNGISILCSPGTTSTLKVRAGLHDTLSAPNTRALADSAGNYVCYDIFTDSGLTTVLPVDGTVPVPVSTGTANVINLYGKAVGKASLPPGTYTDSVAVELTF